MMSTQLESVQSHVVHGELATTMFERTPKMPSYLVVLTAGDLDAATFDRLHALAQAAKDTKVAARYRGALMHVRESQLAQRALDIAMSNEVPPQLASSRFGYVATATDWNPKLAWAFFQAHSADLTSRYSVFEKVLSLADGVPDIFAEAAPPEQIEAWLKANLPASAAPYLAKGMQRARTNAAIRERLRDDVRLFLTSTRG